MSLMSAIRVALAALFVNKGRSALTSLGIVIGIMSVIAMVSAGGGARNELDQGLESVGKDLIMVRPGGTTTMGLPGEHTPLSDDDLRALRDDDELRYLVSGISETQYIPQIDVQTLSGAKHRTTIVGGQPEIQQIRGWTVDAGHFFTHADVAKSASVCLIGHTVRRELFPHLDDPTGQRVRIGSQTLVVLGLLGSKGYAPTGADQDDQIFVPISTLRKKLARMMSRIDIITLAATGANEVPAAVERIRQVMIESRKTRHLPHDDFRVASIQEMSKLALIVARTLNILIIVIASISLIVGGIGIMNIMLVSVTERTREIGIRMAVGATPGDIRNQFLIEAVVLSLVGGIIGVALGLGTAFTLAQLINWPVDYNLFYTGLAFGVSAMVGVFFGLYPAIKASRLDPIEALRYE